ncbi:MULTISPECIES: hypothetical protein [Sphingobacterium]|uniref:Uncharacterized protein n=1 Tax=Sphingobacterium athyrii TaxID=2152717 RepID=A0A363NW90_9SPHI|nr:MULTISPECIES: hypothetical protein [Sphingobacterium]PUV25075.1 hypothetical protein DCO56_09030 [Sphingobacterium athyrii]QIH34844.1 hypothetical protein G6053_18940 [Sphingobacterium sp. DR205]
MKKIFFASVMTLSLLSCRDNKSVNSPVDNVIDNAGSSASGSLKSYRGDELTVNRIYFELIKNDKNLTALNTKIENTFEETGRTLAVYKNILNTSTSYYQDAHQQTKSITDSLVRQQVEKEIMASSEQYNLNVKNIKERIDLINKNNETLTSLYTTFKIRKTLPEIEKYQNAHPLQKDSLDHFVNKQNSLLDELKNLR